MDEDCENEILNQGWVDIASAYATLEQRWPDIDLRSRVHLIVNQRYLSHLLVTDGVLTSICLPQFWRSVHVTD